MASKCDHSFVVVKRDGTLYKYKLGKHHIMSPIPEEVLEIKATISILKALALFWSKLPPDVVDLRKALVAVVTSMMAMDPKWYRERLQFVRRNQWWKDH